jgi:5-methylcytosine-specific restriction endonuclease McrA
MKLCECGCGQELPPHDYPSQQTRFLKGHWTRTKEAKKKLYTEESRKIQSVKRRLRVGDKAPTFGKPHSDEWNHNISTSLDGHIVTEDTKQKISEANTGNPGHWKDKIFSEEHRKNIALGKTGKMTGKDNPNYKGGITSLRHGIRDSSKYRQWRFNIFTRDDYTCQVCRKRGGYIHVHHIKLFSQILVENHIKILEDAKNCEELWDIDNGLTLCKECHLKLRRNEHENLIVGV